MTPVPSDIDLADRILLGLTARQLAALAPATGLVWGLWSLLEMWLPIPVVMIAVAPIAAAGMAVALGRRDGTSLDQLVWAAATHPRTPLSTNPAAPTKQRLRWPVAAIDRSGLIDLGAAGYAVALEATTVNLALRSPDEQDVLTAGFARLLHSLPGRVQVTVASRPVDATRRVRRLRHAAHRLPHPQLQQAAADHADWLTGLTGGAGVRVRRVVVTVTGPTPEAAWHAADICVDACAGFGVTANVLTGADLEAWLATSLTGGTA